MTQTQTTTRLQRFMLDEGRSQADLARRLRITRQTVGIWVRGEEACPRARQAQIAIHLGIPAAAYFDRDGFAIREEQS